MKRLLIILLLIPFFSDAQFIINPYRYATTTTDEATPLSIHSIGLGGFNDLDGTANNIYQSTAGDNAAIFNRRLVPPSVSPGYTYYVQHQYQSDVGTMMFGFAQGSSSYSSGNSYANFGEGIHFQGGIVYAFHDGVFNNLGSAVVGNWYRIVTVNTANGGYGGTVTKMQTSSNKTSWTDIYDMGGMTNNVTWYVHMNSLTNGGKTYYPESFGLTTF